MQINIRNEHRVIIKKRDYVQVNVDNGAIIQYKGIYYTPLNI